MSKMTLFLIASSHILLSRGTAHYEKRFESREDLYMKKGIKYAGIAAATLLTLAPVAAPVVGPATDDKSTDATSINDFFGQYGNAAVPAQVLNQIKDSDDYNTELTSTKFASSVFGKAEFRTFTMNNFDTRLVNAKFKVVALDSKNRELSKNDLQKLFKTTPDSITLKFTVSYTDKNKTEHSESNSYVFSNKDKGTETTPQGQVELAKSINANYTNPYNVAVGSKTLDAELSTSVDMKLTNQNGTAIKVSDIHVGDVHTTFAGALGQTFTREDDTYSKATFEEKGKTYYQSV